MLVTTTPEPVGASCKTGGVAVRTGEDTNHDGLLDPEEVTSTSFVCARPSQLVRVREEPMSPNCGNGGTAIETGPDLDNNGMLDAGEIVSIDYACVCAVGDPPPYY